MIANPSWFQRRKYSGWGLSPKTWQGWAYIGAAVLVFIGLQALPLGDMRINVAVALVFGAIVFADMVHVMVRMPRDERDRLHEAIAERNALWTMIAVLIIGVGYQTAAGIVKGAPAIDPVIIAALIFGVIAKAATNLWLEKKN